MKLFYVSIQSDGQYLMAIDESEKHTLSVWAWQEESVIVKTTVRILYVLIIV